MKNSNRFGFALLATLLLPAVAHADVVWPALFLEGSLLKWWVIGIGLVLELPLFKLATRTSWKRSALLMVGANAVSTVVGIVLIPAAGLGWEFFPGQYINSWMGNGTFSVVGWVATFALAVAVNTLIEGLVLKGSKVSLSRSAPWLAIANGASVGLAFVSLFLSYSHH